MCFAIQPTLLRVAGPNPGGVHSDLTEFLNFTNPKGTKKEFIKSELYNGRTFKVIGIYFSGLAVAHH